MLDLILKIVRGIEAYLTRVQYRRGLRQLEQQGILTIGEEKEATFQVSYMK